MSNSFTSTLSQTRACLFVHTADDRGKEKNAYAILIFIDKRRASKQAMIYIQNFVLTASVE